MLIQLVNGVPHGNPVSESNFRQLFPNTSFPSPLAPADVSEKGFGLYEYSAMPEVARYEKAVEGIPEQDENGFWRQSWHVVGMDEAERAEVDQRKASEVRAERNRRLSESDWTQLADAPVDSLAWSTYRQSLRDIPDQEGFPWTVTWPEQPN